MNILLAYTDPIHRRNWETSGLVNMLVDRGHDVISTEDERLWGSPVRRWLRRGPLRTASYVSRAAAGSVTYHHKLALRDAKRERVWIWLWRLVHLVVDVERMATWLNAQLPPDPWVLSYVSAMRPDVVVLPTLLYDGRELELAACAGRLKIPVISQIASFDTLFCKGGMFHRPRTLLVWGEHSRRQAIEGHGCTPQAVIVTGPPQFDAYHDTGVVYFGRSSKILYAGTSVAYSQEEAAIVNALAEHWGDDLIYRPHPRRRARREDTPGVAFDDAPNPRPEHYRALYEQACCLVTAFSTMAIEMALFGKPSIIIAFGRSSGGWEFSDRARGGLLDHAQYEHMAEVLTWPGIHVCQSLEDVIMAIRAVRRGAFRKYEEALRAKAQAVARCDGHARERICEAIEASWARKAQKGAS